jgi:hypothetical protein
MERLAEEERAMAAVRSLCDSYAAGGMSFRQAMRQIEQVAEDQTDRIVRIGKERHTPEVRT